jgi:hypothetical protein
LESKVKTRDEKQVFGKLFIGEQKVQGEIESNGNYDWKKSIDKLNETIVRKLAVESNIRQYSAQI